MLGVLPYEASNLVEAGYKISVALFSFSPRRKANSNILNLKNLIDTNMVSILLAHDTSVVTRTGSQTVTNRTKTNPILNGTIVFPSTSGVTGTHTSKFSVTSAGLTTSVQHKILALYTAPSSATNTSVPGEIRFNSTYVYLCSATTTWVKAALAIS